MKRKVYILENLGCANCASKIESKIAKLPGVEEATITFATKQLRLKAKEPEQLLTQITEIAHELEPDIIIRERDLMCPILIRRINTDTKERKNTLCLTGLKSAKPCF